MAALLLLGAPAPRAAHGGDGADLASLLPAGAEVRMLLDCEGIYSAPLFGRIMDYIETSDSYRRFEEDLAAWGFRPRGDLTTIALALPQLDRTSSDFFAVARGTIERASVEARLRERPRLREESDALGSYFVDTATDLMYGFGGADLLMAGSREAFVAARAVLIAGAPPADPGFARPGTLWVALAPSAERRRIHPSLASTERLFASLAIDESPSLTLTIELSDDAAAAAAGQELRHVMETLSMTPELEAFGLDRVIGSASITVDGARVDVETSVDAPTWSDFSDTLVQLIAEEVR